MDPKEVRKLMAKDIKDLEATIYHFEEVLRPRVEADKKVLDTLRAKMLKLDVLLDKMKNKETVTEDEKAAAIPDSLR